MLRKVQTENGTVQGMVATDARLTVFRGIPFAAPPVGDLRWRAPQPAADWEGVRDAYIFAPISMQPRPGMSEMDIYRDEWGVDPDIAMNEDCLYLNVWTPAKKTDEKLPVYVWYFGGGLQVGHPAEMEFDGERIARRGVIVVTINYRLNVFGFLSHPEVTAENPDAPTNFGHLDQKYATEWVKRNIAAFGGDPDNITIGGQSAGGGSVMVQLTSPQTAGLFQQAIIQSGVIYGAYIERIGRGFPLADAEKQGQDFFSFLGVKTLAEARALDATFIRDKNNEFKKMWGTVIDNKFMTGKSIDLLLENRRHKVPLLMGYTSTEFMSSPPVESLAELEKLAFEKFGDKEKVAEYMALCKAGNLRGTIKKATFSPFELGARSVAIRSAEAEDMPDSYVYMFDAFIPGDDNPGTFHSVDLWFFFETLASAWRPFTGVHYDLARHMCNYWANFIKTGDPNGNDADGTPMPYWKPYSQGGHQMVFGDKPEMSGDEPGKLMQFMLKHYL